MKTPSQQPSATLDIEREVFSQGAQLIAGIDEVGRGALAGPVSVGVALVGSDAELEVEGLIDSKALSPAKREAMVPLIKSWCKVAVGHVQAAEIDALGMTLSLRLAAQRALAQICTQDLVPDVVLLDGKHDWLTPPQPHLLQSLDTAESLYEDLVWQAWSGTPWSGPVQTVIRGDYLCASIAAASVVAKVERDALMQELSQRYPQFGWAQNKGYGAAKHQEAMGTHGVSAQHRLSWKLDVSAQQLKLAYEERNAATHE